jgi:hypothetical protein
MFKYFLWIVFSSAADARRTGFDIFSKQKNYANDPDGKPVIMR